MPIILHFLGEIHVSTIDREQMKMKFKRKNTQCRCFYSNLYF